MTFVMSVSILVPYASPMIPIFSQVQEIFKVKKVKLTINLCLLCIDFYVWDAVSIFNHPPRMFLSTDFAFRIMD